MKVLRTMGQTKPITVHIKCKISEHWAKERILRPSLKRKMVIYISSGTRMVFNFLRAKMKARRRRKNVF